MLTLALNVDMVALERGVTLLGEKVPGSLDHTTNVCGGNQPIRLVSADLSK